MSENQLKSANPKNPTNPGSDFTAEAERELGRGVVLIRKINLIRRIPVQTIFPASGGWEVWRNEVN